MPTNYGPEVLPYPQPTEAPDGPGAFLALLQAMQTGGPWVYGTLTQLQAVTGKYALQMAVVNADPTIAKNGFYYWSTVTNQWALLPLLTAGSTLIAPSSVAGTGVSVSNIGSILISAASSASINGVFTSQYDNYLLLADLTFSVSSLLKVNLRAGGSDSTAANYNYQAVQGSGTAAGAGAATGQTAFFFSNTPGGQVDCEVKLYGPAIATATRYSSEFYGLAGGAQNVGVIGGSNGLTSVFDGLTLAPSGGGTMTGNVRIYGFNNG